MVSSGCKAQSSGSAESEDSLSKVPFYERDFAQQTSQAQGHPAQGRPAQGRIHCQLNADSTYVLCKRALVEHAKIPHPIRAYAVYDLKNQKKTYSDRIDGDVAWYDPHTIHLKRLPRVPGGIEDERDYHTYVDVRRGTPVKKRR